MGPIVVTGGTGRLGRHLVARLQDGGHAVRVLSRRAGPGRVVGDLRDGSGLEAAVGDAEVVVHAATNARFNAVDVAGTERLLAACRHAGVGHVLYVSIVGVDRNPMPYYAAKLRAERFVAASGLGFTIARGTQFHDLVAGVVRRLRLGPLAVVPRDVVLQPNDPAEFAARLADLAGAPPVARVSEFAGPEAATLAEFAERWQQATGRAARLREISLPGKAMAALRSGAQLPGPDAVLGHVTFEEWLARPAS